MLKLLRFAESQKNVDGVLTWFGYGACALCALGSIALSIALIIQHT